MRPYRVDVYYHSISTIVVHADSRDEAESAAWNMEPEPNDPPMISDVFAEPVDHQSASRYNNYNTDGDELNTSRVLNLEE